MYRSSADVLTMYNNVVLPQLTIMFIYIYSNLRTAAVSPCQGSSAQLRVTEACLCAMKCFHMTKHFHTETRIRPECSNKYKRSELCTRQQQWFLLRRECSTKLASLQVREHIFTTKKRKKKKEKKSIYINNKLRFYKKLLQLRVSCTKAIIR